MPFAVGMAEIALGIDDVADELLKLGCIRETTVALAVPDQLIVAGDGEDAAGAGHQHDLAELGAEGGKQFLRHPAGAQHPVALRAVGDADDGFLRNAHVSTESTRTVVSA